MCKHNFPYLCLFLLHLDLGIFVERFDVLADELHQIGHHFAEIGRHLEGKLAGLEISQREEDFLTVDGDGSVRVSQFPFEQLAHGGFPAVKIAFFLLLFVLQAVPLQHQGDFALRLLQNARQQADRLFEDLLVVGTVDQLGNLRHVSLEVGQIFAT